MDFLWPRIHFRGHRTSTRATSTPVTNEPNSSIQKSNSISKINANDKELCRRARPESGSTPADHLAYSNRYKSSDTIDKSECDCNYTTAYDRRNASNTNHTNQINHHFCCNSTKRLNTNYCNESAADINGNNVNCDDGDIGSDIVNDIKASRNIFIATIYSVALRALHQFIICVKQKRATVFGQNVALVVCYLLLISSSSFCGAHKHDGEYAIRMNNLIPSNGLPFSFRIYNQFGRTFFSFSLSLSPRLRRRGARKSAGDDANRTRRGTKNAKLKQIEKCGGGGSGGEIDIY